MPVAAYGNSFCRAFQEFVVARLPPPPRVFRVTDQAGRQHAREQERAAKETSPACRFARKRGLPVGQTSVPPLFST